MSSLANAVLHTLLQNKVHDFIVDHGGLCQDITIPTTCPVFSKAINFDLSPLSKVLFARPDLIGGRPPIKPTFKVDFKTSPSYYLETSNIMEFMPFEALQFVIHHFESKYLGASCVYITLDRSGKEQAFRINHPIGEAPEVLQLLCPTGCRYPIEMQAGIKYFLAQEFPDITIRKTYGGGSWDMMVLLDIKRVYNWQDLLAELL